VITPYSGMDPEVSNFGNQPVSGRRRGAVSAQPQLLVHHQRGVLTMIPLLQTIAFRPVRTRHMRKLAYLSLALGVALACRDPEVPEPEQPEHRRSDDASDALQDRRRGAGTSGRRPPQHRRVQRLRVRAGPVRAGVVHLRPGRQPLRDRAAVRPARSRRPRFGGNLWVVRFANIRAANNLMTALGSSALIGMTAAEKEATTGFAQTIQALDFLEVINTRDTIGAPIAVNTKLGDPPAPIQPRDVVFTHIVQLLDSADTHLAAGARPSHSSSRRFLGIQYSVQLPEIQPRAQGAGAGLPRSDFRLRYLLHGCSDPAHERLDVHRYHSGVQPRRRRVSRLRHWLGGPERRPVRPDAGEVVCSSVAQGLG